MTISRRAVVAIAIGPLAFLAVFFAWPVAAIIGRGLSVQARIATVLADPGLRSVAWFTVWQAALSTALTLVLGLMPAYVLARYRFPGPECGPRAGRRVPFVLPTVVVGAAFLALLPTSLEQTVWAILIAHVYFNLAVVVRTVGTMWSQLDPRLEDAAADARRLAVQGAAPRDPPAAYGPLCSRRRRSSSCSRSPRSASSGSWAGLTIRPSRWRSGS